MRDLGCSCREELLPGCWKAEPLRGPWEVLLGSSTRSALESLSNRQRLDKKQECCPPGREESRVEDRRFTTRWDVSEIHYTPRPPPQLHSDQHPLRRPPCECHHFPSFALVWSECFNHGLIGQVCQSLLWSQSTSHQMTILIRPCKYIKFIWVCWTSKHRWFIGCFYFWYLNNKELNLEWQIYSNKLIFSGIKQAQEQQSEKQMVISSAALWTSNLNVGVIIVISKTWNLHVESTLLWRG